MRKEECYQLGTIQKPHGLRGEVAVFLDVDDPSLYTELESVFVDQGGQLIPFFIEGVNVQAQKAIFKFEEVDSVEAAGSLTGRELYLPLAALPPLEGNAFYYHEIIGFRLVDVTSGEVGTISEVISGQQDLLVADRAGIEILVPLHDELIVRLDREKQELHMQLPEGLLDIYLEA
ncbi:ribosome maturation factor RimM [Cesiribacter andamanensis]|uniref:Ribosome maturation factor RimM n=1 Tax=Cesiribacter andamanensis AMV16 TaxID=1279009 RepID=M7N9I7_9BACT|nr:ribosome maturation factor RimM [Cesiribacter andamanensis]EMR03856.1 Ribosome maturation factor rimM [Cesiribacter andamanensis AMV16]